MIREFYYELDEGEVYYKDLVNEVSVLVGNPVPELNFLAEELSSAQEFIKYQKAKTKELELKLEALENELSGGPRK